MAHGIQFNDAALFNSGIAAWHGLGITVNKALSPREGVREIIPWEPEPVYFRNPITNQFDLVPGFAANIRSDDQSPLGIVTDNYKIVNNSVLGDFAEALAGSDAAVQVETVGSLLGGKRIFMLAKIPKTIRVGIAGEDETMPYLLFSNSHDGTGAFFAMWTAVRVVCNNTLTMALGANFENAEQAADMGRGFRFRHTGDIMARVGEAKRALRIATEETERFQLLASDLANKQITAAELSLYYTSCYVTIYGPRPVQDGTDERLEQIQEWDLRLAQRKQEWTDLLDNQMNRIAGINGTIWQALQTVTQWHDHVRSATRVTGDRRVHNNLFGEAARDKRGAFVAAVAMLKA